MGRHPARRSGADHADALGRIRRMCLALPDTQEQEAWRAPTFRVRGKMFAMFMDHHHKDGHLAIWCNAPPGARGVLVASDPVHFFVPPYVGTRGWLGIRLDTGLDWDTIADFVKEAYDTTAHPLK